ncbi:MAG: P-II family nitrogen regulator [Rhodobacteraceae bacterium]|nr:P-II family nitrogen regulator [Paracoccaceae bacterium]
MKSISAIVRPSMVDPVREALVAKGIHGMTVTEARGFGRQRGHKEIYRGAEYEVSFVPKIKIEVIVDDGDLDGTIAAILEVAKTGKTGDGKIFVSTIDEAIRIRTGERGKEAL